MSNPYYVVTGVPANRASLASATIRSEFALVQAGFDSLISAGINAVPIGLVTPSSGAFTTLSASGGITGALTGNVTGNLTGNSSGTHTGAVVGNVTGNVSGTSGSTTGNAATATALQTARLINGSSFNGTADITVAAAAGTLTGATLAAGVTASSLTSVGTLASLTVSGAFTTQGNNILGNAQGDTLNVGNGDLIKDGSGNVGIGLSPTYRLDVLTSSTIPGRIRSSGASTALMLGDSGTTGDSLYIGTVGNDFRIITNNIERFRVDSSGNVGLGKTAAVTLDVNGRIAASGQSTSTIGILSGSNTLYAAYGIGRLANEACFGIVGQINNFLSGTLVNDAVVSTVAGGNLWMGTAGNFGLNFSTFNTLRMSISGAGVIQDASGFELGYKDLVQNIQSGGAGYTFVVADRGKSVVMNGSGNFTIPASVFSGGQSFVIYNNTGGVQTLVQGGGLTLRFGAGPATGNRTLAGNAFCTIYFINATTACISGSGVS